MARTKTDCNRAEKIIQASEELFARYGFERTSMDDIAKHLEIGKGSIYLDFRTKEEILFAILRRHADFMHGKCLARMAAKDRPALEIFKQVIQDDSLDCYERVTRDIHTPEALLHTSLQIRHRFADYFVKKRAMLLELLRRAADEGEIPPEKATEDVVVAIMMATGSLFPPYFNNYSESVTMTSRDDLIRQAKNIVDLLIDGLRSRSR